MGKRVIGFQLIKIKPALLYDLDRIELCLASQNPIEQQLYKLEDAFRTIRRTEQYIVPPKWFVYKHDDWQVTHKLRV